MGEGGVTRRSFLKIVGGVVIAAGVGLGVIYYLSRGSQTPTTVRGIATTTITIPTSGPTSTPVGPARGGELRIELISEIVRLDPHASTAAVDRQVYQAIYDHFLDLDEKGNVVPAICESWSQPDSKTYIFRIRDGIKFHDGTKLDADAVVWNFNRMLGKLDKKLLPNPNARASEVAPIDSVRAEDNLTVGITLKRPFAPFLSILTDRVGMFISPTSFEKDPEGFFQKPVGAGAFKFVEWRKGDRLVVERFDSYYRSGLPYLNRIVYTFQADATQRLNDLRSGTVDMIQTFAQKDIDVIKREASQGNLSYSVKATWAWQGYELNNRKPPFDNKLLRKAFMYAIDVDEIVNTIYYGIDIPANYGPITPAHGVFYDPNYRPHSKWPKADLDMARKMLKDAGYPDGFEFELQIGVDPIAKLEAELIQSQLARVGIKIKITQLDFTRQLTNLEQGNYQASAIGWSGRPDPDQNSYMFWRTGGSFNFMGYSNPNVDELFDQARIEADPSRRANIYRQIINILYDDSPYIFVRYPADLKAWRPYVKGFVHIADGMIRPAGLWISRQG
jgi:peptide/nickel transport system substrate-binding protein